MPVRITINSEAVEGGTGPSLFDYAERMGVRVPTSCHKQGKCRECLVEVLQGVNLLSPPSPEEQHLKDNFRLSCRCQVVADAGNIRCQTLRRAVRYTISLDALDRWAKSRLRLESQEDGGIRAHFHFDGSTCTNAGRALAFDYTIWLGSADDGHRILKTACSPAADDAGNEHTCSFLRNRHEYQVALETPPPFAGRPLDEVLRWDSPVQASGCLCNDADRQHKWRLVLQTLHYHLVHG